MTVISMPDRGVDEVSERLIASAARLSRNAMTEIDWSAPMDPELHGCSPEWSTLYGTDYWNELTEAQKIQVTRHEFASIMCVGVWFEMILDQLILRDQYLGDYHSPEFQFALTEIADECRHSIMFAKASQKMVGTSYRPSRTIGLLGKIFQHTARGAVSYAGILVAEEILDVFQRECMRDDRVLPFVRTVNEIHVLEESRHMKFAREQVRQSVAGMSDLRRRFCALYVSVGAVVIVSSLVQPKAYADAGLDVERALAERRTNKHFQTMVRSNCMQLMEFLDEVGLLTRAARRNYRRVHMI